jgi:hypothetical protein
MSFMKMKGIALMFMISYFQSYCNLALIAITVNICQVVIIEVFT